MTLSDSALPINNKKLIKIIIILISFLLFIGRAESENNLNDRWSECHEMHLLLSQQLEKIWISKNPESEINHLDSFLGDMYTLFSDNPQCKGYIPNLTDQAWSKCHKMYLILSRKIERIWIRNNPG